MSKGPPAASGWNCTEKKGFETCIIPSLEPAGSEHRVSMKTWMPHDARRRHRRFDNKFKFSEDAESARSFALTNSAFQPSGRD